MKLTWSRFVEMNTPAAWRARFYRNRWILAWSGFALLFLFMVGGTWAFWDRPWLGNFLSVFGTGITVVFALITYLQTQAASDRATREQMDHMQALTQKQIDALAANTNRQIQEYSRETTKVVSKLSENSLLLAELLKRELEEAIGENNDLHERAEKEFKKAHQRQFLRTPDERAAQIAQSGRFLERVKAWGQYLNRKYQNLIANFRDSL